MQQVPSTSLGEEIGMKRGDLSDPEDEIESRLKSQYLDHKSCPIC